MALVQFENSPSTNTPLSATNLNNNFNEFKATKLWENDGTITSWDEGALNIDVSNYSFLLIVSSTQTMFVPSNFHISLSWVGWLNEVSKDVITTRDVYRDGNDVKWDKCFYRGINNFTGSGYTTTIDYPQAVYGFKF